MSKFYNYKEINRAYRTLGIKRGDTIYLSGDLFLLGGFSPKEKLLETHFNILKKIVGNKGTISFPTFSYSLANKKVIFSPENTKSETGVFTEYLRNKKGSVRQLHPLSSITSLGKNAKYISSENTSHAHGHDSPFQRLYYLKAKFISIGLKPNITCSQVHHFETLLNVPYRFTKEFIFKVRIKKNKIIKKKFYLYVMYNYLRKIKRNKNLKIFKNFKKKYKIIKVKCGRGYIYSYSMRDFQDNTLKLMKKDLYFWMTKEPKKKIWKSL